LKVESFIAILNFAPVVYTLHFLCQNKSMSL